MCSKPEFLAMLDKHELPHDIFNIVEYDDKSIDVVTPHGIILETDRSGRHLRFRSVELDAFCDVVLDSIFDLEEYILNPDKLLAPYAAEYKIRREHAKLLQEVAALREENAALRLLPGASEYFTTKAHYENLAKK